MGQQAPGKDGEVKEGEKPKTAKQRMDLQSSSSAFWIYRVLDS